MDSELDRTHIDDREIADAEWKAYLDDRAEEMADAELAYWNRRAEVWESTHQGGLEAFD